MKKKLNTVKNPLADRIRAGIRDFLDGLAETLDGMLRPEPVLIPVRKGHGPRGR